MRAGRLVRVRLEDVPLEDRIAHARALARESGDPSVEAELLDAAFSPSKRVRFIPERAVAAVLPDLLPQQRRAAA